MSVCITKEIEVEIDLADFVDDLTDSELRQLGLRSTESTTDELPASDEQCWRLVARALRDGDQRALTDLLSRMAWDQGGGVIPVVGLKPLH